MNNNIKQLIETSFLNESEKKQLLQILLQNGENSDFYSKFNSLLIKELQQKLLKAQTNSEQLELETAELEKEFSKQETILTNKLTEQLKQIPITDFESKNKVIDEYNNACLKLGKELENKAHALFAKITIGNI